MSNRRRKTFYWLFKITSILISCALPIWAIWERFPMWIETHGETHVIGSGGVLALAVLLIIFRKTVFGFIRDQLKLKYAPPLFGWGVFIVISHALEYLANFLLRLINFMQDMNEVFWLGFIGCAIGVALTFIAEDRFGKEQKDE